MSNHRLSSTKIGPDSSWNLLAVLDRKPEHAPKRCPGACLRRGRTGGLLCSISSLLLNSAKGFHCLLGIGLTRQFSGCVKCLQHLVLGLLRSVAGSGYVSMAHGRFRGDREMRTSAAGAGFASAMSYFGRHGVQIPPPYSLL